MLQEIFENMKLLKDMKDEIQEALSNTKQGQHTENCTWKNHDETKDT